MLPTAAPLASQTTQNPILVLHNNLQFAHQAGAAAAPPPQTVRVYSAPAAVQFTATAATQTGGGWLFVNNAITFTGNSGTAGQQDLAISVSPGLPAGVYNGTVTVTSGSTTVTITVAYTVTASPVLRLEPASLVNTAVEAKRTTSIPLAITSSGTPIQYS